MIIKKGFVCRRIGKENVVIAVGEASDLLNGLIKLNDSGAFLWDQLKEGAEEEDLVSSLQKKYDVSRERAEEDTRAFLDTLRRAGCLE